MSTSIFIFTNIICTYEYIYSFLLVRVIDFCKRFHVERLFICETQTTWTQKQAHARTHIDTQSCASTYAPTHANTHMRSHKCKMCTFVYNRIPVILTSLFAPPLTLPYLVCPSFLHPTDSPSSIILFYYILLDQCATFLGHAIFDTWV